MHVRYPKEYVIAEGGYATDSGCPDIMYYPLVCHPSQIYTKEADYTLFFMEHRRENYSDVCHAKVDVPKYPVPEHRYYLDFYGDYLTSHLPLTSVATAARMGVQATAASSSSGNATCYSILSRGDFAILGKVITQWHNPRSGGFEDTINVYVWCTWLHEKQDKPGRTRTRNTRNLTMTLRRLYDRTNHYMRTEYKYGGYYSESQNVLARLGLIYLLYPYDQAINEGNKVPIGLSICKNEIPLIMRMIYDFMYEGGSVPSQSVYEYTETAVEWQSEDDMPDFLLHEPDCVMRGVSDVLFGKGFTSYWRNVLIQNAYLDAVRTVPRLNDNSISNLIEIAGFIKALVVDKKIEIPKSLGGLWLSYRYQYQTTKLDAEEAIQFVHRHMDLGDWTSLHNYGMATESIVIDNSEPVTVVCRCCLDISPKELDTLGKAWRALYTYGLTPSFYVVWDMIPYSFIVDWLIPIGQVAAAWDAEREYNGKYDIINTIFSLSYYRNSPRGLVKFYTRWLSEQPTELRGMYFTETDPSTNTKTKRLLDVLSLTIGSKEAR